MRAPHHVLAGGLPDVAVWRQCQATRCSSIRPRTKVAKSDWRCILLGVFEQCKRMKSLEINKRTLFWTIFAPRQKEDLAILEQWQLGQPKVNEVKIFLLFLKFMKHPQTKFHAHSIKESQVIKSQKVKMYYQVKIYRCINFSCSTVFSLCRYFIETTTDINMLLHAQLQFCSNNNGFVAISDVIMLFCPLLGDWMLCRIGVVREKCGLTVLVFIMLNPLCI